MGRLKVLPASIANMIAAGEVVQRPASVVKELMENAADAGASQISVIITDAGRTLIQCIDNGCGMSAADANLCFERHATSKIATAGDLEEIMTYGFRGEALASIAAVAEVTLKTRREKDENGVQVVTGDSGTLKSSSVSCPVGANFAVRNLFYNTPARRKFLKSDNVELKHIIEEFTRIAITRPETGFSLSHNGKDIFVLKKAKSLKFRILDLLGSGVMGDVVDIDTRTSFLNISGFAAKPDSAKKTPGNQYFFVNGRFFRSAYLHKAVMKAYGELIPEGFIPSYFIFLEIDSHSIDVNIHPTKTEIKFEDESLVFQTVYAALKETLGRNSFGAGIDFDTEGAVPLPQLGKTFEQYKGEIKAPEAHRDPDFNPFKPNYGFSDHVDKNENYGKLFEERALPVSRAIILQDKYILSPVASGLMAVNIRRARERILYENTLKALKGTGHITQEAMFPVQVQVGAATRLLFDENAEMLARLGFDIAAFGTDTIAVNGVPEGYSCEEGKVRTLIQDITTILSEGTGALSEVLTQRLAEKFAILGASNGGGISSPAEAQSLIDTLFACENAELTSNGKRIVNIIKTEDIDKMF